MDPIPCPTDNATAYKQQSQEQSMTGEQILKELVIGLPHDTHVSPLSATTQSSPDSSCNVNTD